MHKFKVGEVYKVLSSSTGIEEGYIFDVEGVTEKVAFDSSGLALYHKWVEHGWVNIVNVRQDHTIILSEKEALALQTLLGFFLYHTSEEIFSVANKLSEIVDDDDLDYSKVQFHKNDDGGAPSKKYKHNNFSIGFKGNK